MLDKIALWGLLAGMAALWVWNWSITRMVERNERKIQELQAKLKFKQDLEEDRCHFCKERAKCPAFDTGVLYPCPYFKKEDHHGTEK